ncbi:MAG TPA: DciA family protein [Candidatus Moranbacteria bacterium]|nr:DciA family protein [Candidatus Moranbacteria bacterium]HRZ33607.1 DciA family protein [Candidatus Moranbacteria bacterium]
MLDILYLIMKKIGSLLNKKELVRKKIDQKTIFYIFEMIIKEEYGKQGVKNIKPNFFGDKKIFIKSANSFWSDEISEQKKDIIKKINEQLGENEVADIIVSN